MSTAFARDPTVEAKAASEWPNPQPLPVGSPPVPQFDLQMLPEAFRSMVEDVADRVQGPPDFAAAPIMVAAGSVIGRQCGIQPTRHDDWLVVPNVWGMNIGRPGLLKTPFTNAALKPIARLESSKRSSRTAPASTISLRSWRH